MTDQVVATITPGIECWWQEKIDDSGHPVPLAIMVRAYLRNRLGSRLDLPRRWPDLVYWIEFAIDRGQLTADNCPLLLPPVCD